MEIAFQRLLAGVLTIFVPDARDRCNERLVITLCLIADAKPYITRHVCVHTYVHTFWHTQLLCTCYYRELEFQGCTHTLATLAFFSSTNVPTEKKHFHWLKLERFYLIVTCKVCVPFVWFCSGFYLFDIFPQPKRIWRNNRKCEKLTVCVYFHEQYIFATWLKDEYFKTMNLIWR